MGVAAVGSPTLNGMRAPLTDEVLEEKVARASAAGAEGHRQLAAQLLAWAEHPHERDEVSTADLLVSAGEQFALAKDHARALDAYRAGAAGEVATSPDPRGFMVQALLDLGRTREAQELSEELRRTRPATPETYHLVGEAWEAAGDLDSANRWLTRGVLLAESQGDQMAWAMLLLGRLRVRRALGFPPDDYDQAALDIVQDSIGDDAAEEDDDAAPTPTHAVVTRQGEHTVLDLF